MLLLNVQPSVKHHRYNRQIRSFKTIFQSPASVLCHCVHVFVCERVFCMRPLQPSFGVSVGAFAVDLGMLCVFSGLVWFSLARLGLAMCTAEKELYGRACVLFSYNLFGLKIDNSDGTLATLLSCIQTLTHTFTHTQTQTKQECDGQAAKYTHTQN